MRVASKSCDKIRLTKSRNLHQIPIDMLLLTEHNSLINTLFLKSIQIQYTGFTDSHTYAMQYACREILLVSSIVVALLEHNQNLLR